MVFNIVMPIYEGVDLLDVAAPFEMFSWMAVLWKERTVKIKIAAETVKILKTRGNMQIKPDISFDDCGRKKLQADLLWVPGGDVKPLKKLMKNTVYLDFIKKQSENAVYVTSVCEGAMLLAAAGLLDGYEATTHWAFIPCLKNFPDIKIAEDYPRFVVDGNRITGGGISSGLDESLKLIAMISNEEIAEKVQLNTQYFPKPPFKAKIPEPYNFCPLDNA